MKFIERTVEKLLNTDYEKFTDYIITALAVGRADPHFKKEDYKRILWLKDNVHEDLKTSMYKLDRLIDPSKVNDDPTKYTFLVTFTSDHLIDEEYDQKQVIKLKAEQLQAYLCNAIQEVTELVFENLWAYNEDFVFKPVGAEDNNEDEF